jgi:hypothetical protein
MSASSAYKLRRSPGAEAFAAAWDAAIAEGAKRLVDVAFERAFDGVEVPVFDRHGIRQGARYHYSDRLLMFLLRAHHPDRYRYANRAGRAADEPSPPPASPPVADAIAAMLPAPPEDPATFLHPDVLSGRLAVADIGDGHLPLRYAEHPVDPSVSPLGPHFEEMIEAAKREGRDPSPEEWFATHGPSGRTRRRARHERELP